MRPTDKATADSRSVQSFAIIKSTEHGNFVIGRFHARARNGLSVWDESVYSHALPTDTPSPIVCEGRAWLYTGFLERIIPSSNCPSKLTDKVRRIVHSKLKLFHFQIKKYYLSDAKYQTDNPSHTNNPSLVRKRPFLLQWMMSRLGLELGVCVSAFAFSQRLFSNWLLTFLCVK